MAKKKKSSKKSKKQKVEDICRRIKYIRDINSAELIDALFDGDENRIKEHTYLDKRLAEIADRVGCSGISKKSVLNKSAFNKLRKSASKLKV